MTGFFIMKLWQTGNVGPHNIAKIEANPKKGYESYDVAKTAMTDLKEKKDWEVNSGMYTFTIMELFW
jgi:hypothetical protein